MVVSDVGKLVILCVITAGIFALVFTNQAEWADVDQWLGVIGGYLFGNGVNAVRKTAPTSVIVPPMQDGQVATVTGLQEAQHDS